jgi:hypothetical protein
MAKYLLKVPVLGSLNSGLALKTNFILLGLSRDNQENRCNYPGPLPRLRRYRTCCAADPVLERPYTELRRDMFGAC